MYFIKDLIATIGYPGLAALMALEATIIPVPSAVVLGFAGYLCYLGQFNIIAVVLVASVGSTFGSLLMYGLGRWGGRPFLDRYGKYLGLSQKRILKANGWFGKYGDWAVLLSQMVPIARDLIPFPAGISMMRAERFALLSFLGSLPFCFALAMVGLYTGPGWEGAVELVDRYDIAILVVVLVPLAIYIAWKWCSKRLMSSKELE